MNYEGRLCDREVAIFLFHGVIHPNACIVRNYTRKHLDADYFSVVIRRLKACGTPISMEDIRLHYEDGRPLPPRAFAITFDDGFENNLTVAAPILLEEKVPATFYVTTGLVDTNLMAWIDRIEYAIELRPQGILKLPWGERVFRDVEDRKQLLNEIRIHVKRDSSIDSDGLASDIQQQLDVPTTYVSNHPLDRKLNWQQVRTLATEPSFIVAGHSHTHRILEHLPDAELEWEIDTSLKLLEEKAGIRSVHYSYPEGLSFCYSDRVIGVLKQRGIRCCPSAEDGTNGSAVDLFHLKRVMVT
jgi:peptidoglycan/xylan/chitin deacetylase (PgdA/CDA1 family)